MMDITAVLSTHFIRILEIALLAAVLWQLLVATYNVFLHPLRKFPGPLLQRASGLPWAIQNALGSQAFRTQMLHDRYGPVVRIGPNHLSFTSIEAWKDIYGSRPAIEGTAAGGGGPEMRKAKMFAETVDDVPRSILNADYAMHQRYRRALAQGFSDGSMRAQEGIIIRYVDKLSARLRECSGGVAGGAAAPVNIEAWYNWASFDLAGDLIFGQSFRCLDRAEYHPWVAFIFNAIRFSAVMTSLKYVGLGFVVDALFRLGGMRAVATLQKSTDEMLNLRLGMVQEREDLFEGLLKKREVWNLSFDQLSANAIILVLAGSETTATTLAGASYLLVTQPEVLQRLEDEVRSTFRNASEITINSVSRLSYMLAVLNETLRLYPPVPSGLIREVPAGGVEIASRQVPAGTFVEMQHWSVNHSKDNWSDRWEFKPERFLGTNKGTLDRPDGLQPFSVGPRNCIGRNLAYAEMRMILARIIFDFDLKQGEDNESWIERQRAFGLWERIPLNIYLQPAIRPAGEDKF